MMVSKNKQEEKRIKRKALPVLSLMLALLYAAISEGYLVVTDEAAAETLVYQKAN